MISVSRWRGCAPCWHELRGSAGYRDSSLFDEHAAFLGLGHEIVYSGGYVPSQVYLLAFGQRAKSRDAVVEMPFLAVPEGDVRRDADSVGPEFGSKGCGLGSGLVSLAEEGIPIDGKPLNTRTRHYHGRNKSQKAASVLRSNVPGMAKNS